MKTIPWMIALCCMFFLAYASQSITVPVNVWSGGGGGSGNFSENVSLNRINASTSAGLLIQTNTGDTVVTLGTGGINRADFASDVFAGTFYASDRVSTQSLKSTMSSGIDVKASDGNVSALLGDYDQYGTLHNVFYSNNRAVGKFMFDANVTIGTSLQIVPIRNQSQQGIALTAQNGQNQSLMNTGQSVLIRSGNAFTPVPSSSGSTGGILQIISGNGNENQGGGGFASSGAGGNLQIISGSGGFLSGGTGAGTTGSGGSIQLTSGNGGNSNHSSVPAGIGGAFQFTSGQGGIGIRSNGGNGGTLTFTTGQGGQTFNNGTLNRTAGNGGAFSFIAGTGGTATLSTPNKVNQGGIGGGYTMSSGQGGIASSSTLRNVGGNSGQFTLTTGQGAQISAIRPIAGNSGNVVIASGNGGIATLNANQTVAPFTYIAGNSGNIVFFTGNAGGLNNNNFGGNGTAGSAGNITFTGGTGGAAFHVDDKAGNGGHVLFRGGIAGTNTRNGSQNGVNGSIYFLSNSGFGFSNATPNQQIQVLGNVNVSGTVYYGALVANSPHAFGADDVGHTRICTMATDGVVTIETVELVGSTYQRVIRADESGHCNKVLTTKIDILETEVQSQGQPSIRTQTVTTKENIWTKEKTQLIEETFRAMPQYRPNVQYTVQDTFVYNGIAYEVLQSHISQADWLPPNVPALYKVKILHELNQITEWRQPQGSHDCYPLNALVTYQGSTWKNTGSSCNVWPPGVFGWVRQ